jgi:hypothetical protein
MAMLGRYSSALKAISQVTRRLKQHRQTAGKPPIVPLHTMPMPNAPAVKGSSQKRQQFIIRMRLAHALDGVKIL